MARSMTGYGRAEEEADGLKVTVEAKSVNHRFLEVMVKSTGRVFALDSIAKKAVKDRFSRGFFEVNVSITQEASSAPAAVSLNEPLLMGYLSAAGELAKRFSIGYPPSFGDLLQVKDLFSVGGAELDTDKAGAVLKSALDRALGQVEAAREAEGAQALADVRGRFETISALAERIKNESGSSAAERFGKLRERISKLAGEAALDENRIVQEAALLADRSDISEEYDRLRSHLAQVDSLLASAGPVGRKLEFFTQEINREVNTMGSKSASAEATALVVEVKSELEKIREQAQNIE